LCTQISVCVWARAQDLNQNRTPTSLNKRRLNESMERLFTRVRQVWCIKDLTFIFFFSSIKWIIKIYVACTATFVHKIIKRTLYAWKKVLSRYLSSYTRYAFVRVVMVHTSRKITSKWQDRHRWSNLVLALNNNTVLYT